MRYLFYYCLWLFSVAVSGDEINSIKIFINDTNTVAIDNPHAMELATIFNMDDADRIKKEMKEHVNSYMKEKGIEINTEQDAINAQNQIKSDLSSFFKSPQGKTITEQMKRSLLPAIESSRLNVTKVPAIVFNDKHIIYGVRSLDHSITIYNKRIGQE